MSRDLAEIVQEMRMLMWRAVLGPARYDVRQGWPSYDGVPSVRAQAAQLEAIASASQGERRSEAHEVASAFHRIADELEAGPRIPSEDELVRRCVRGEIGDRTVRTILGWDPYELIEACLVRGLPPICGALGDE